MGKPEVLRKFKQKKFGRDYFSPSGQTDVLATSFGFFLKWKSTVLKKSDFVQRGIEIDP